MSANSVANAPERVPRGSPTYLPLSTGTAWQLSEPPSRVAAERVSPRLADGDSLCWIGIIGSDSSVRRKQYSESTRMCRKAQHGSHTLRRVIQFAFIGARLLVDQCLQNTRQPVAASVRGLSIPPGIMHKACFRLMSKREHPCPHHRKDPRAELLRMERRG